MIDSLLASLGLYGAALVVAFVAGMFPLVSIEVFLVGCAAWGIEPDVLVVLIGLGVIGHQIAKTLTYYAGAGLFELPRGKVRARLEAAKHRAERWNERWNKRPKLIMFVAAATGLPPLYLLGFVARPLMKMSIGTFSVITVIGRLLRYTTLVVVTRMF